ncbi:polymeric immunoglobulin receptor [Lontra canadensis]|uniref:polymeric immunoglobulin receptor n=1 Tax=Lontra canadensis TaxID=76717 RepID=UPI0013F2E0DD|nr:polymeric immunoglobulin receptor [Lontra canadensis]
MGLLFLTCLLAVFPVVSMKSPIFGPQEVSSVEGRSVSITCYYPDSSVNRHTRKYWCRQGSQGRCTTLVSSEGYISRDYEGRANLTNFPESNTFVVNINHLTQGDSGRYKCGLGINSRGLSFDVNLEVLRGPGLQNGVEVYVADLGGTVTINCLYKLENSGKKSLCKMIGQACLQVIDSYNNVDPNYAGRAEINIPGTSQLMFSVIIKRVRLSDAGMYRCEVGAGSSAEKSYAELQVLKPESELLYGDLRGSVTFDCALGPKVKDTARFLCRKRNGKDCDVVINTLGQKAQAFEGRILLIPKENGSFSVSITNLRKEDAGYYLCGTHSDGQPQESYPTQPWQLFVNEETIMPQIPSVVKGVVGGSVAVLCPYNPKEADSLKYWCRWEDTQNGRCQPLVESAGLVKKQYNGRLTLHEEPGNGTYTVILNQLTPEDAGFYWCLTNGDNRWRYMVELKIVEGEPGLKVPKNAVGRVGETFKLSCHFPCKYYSFEKYWCKWSDRGCKTLPSQDEGPSQAFVNCDQKSQIISMTLNPVSKADEGWYWCGVKDGPRYGETMAVYLSVEERVKGSQDISQVDSAPGEEVVESSVREVESKVIQNPRLFVDDKTVKDVVDPADGSKVSVDASRSAGQSGSSTVLVSTLVPLGLVLAVGAVVVAVLRARHRKNIDRVSIRSYRTDISMSDFENSKDFGAIDNMGASPVTQETTLGGKDECGTATENTTETEEPKKAKRSSKEEADMAYTAFLIQTNNMAAKVQESPEKV